MLAAGSEFGRYRIQSELGAGGMGRVYRAFDTTLHRHVALKVLDLDDSLPLEEAVARLTREARLVAALDHPNVVQVFDAGEVSSIPFVSMELVDGTSLRAYVGDRSTPLETKLTWLLAVASALASAHQSRLIHRDIKPDNVMIRRDGVVKVLDFGIARRTAKEASPLGPATATGGATGGTTGGPGGVVGTPMYMAPEQLRNEVLDGRCDQFAWGVMAYELLAGVSPWGEGDTWVVLGRMLTIEPPPLRSRALEVSDRIASIVERALAKNSADRYPSMEALSAAWIEAGVAEVRRAAPASAPELDPSRPRSELGLAATETDFSGAADEPKEPQIAPAPTLADRPKVAPRGRARWTVVVLSVAALTALAALAVRFRSERSPGATPLPVPSASSAASALPAVSSPPTYRERRIVPDSADSVVSDAAVTADGNSMVLATSDGFWIQPVRGGARKRLGAPAGVQPAVYILSDPTKVVAIAQSVDQVRAWLTPLDGSPAALLYEGAGSGAWASPDGQLLAVAREGRGLDIVRVSGGPPVHIASHAVWGARFSPDGKRIAFLDGAFSGHLAPALTIAATDGSAVRRVYSDASLTNSGENLLAWPEDDRLLVASHGVEQGVWIVQELLLQGPLGAPSAPREIWRTRAAALHGLSVGKDVISVIKEQSREDIRVATLGPNGHLRGATRLLTHSDSSYRHVAWLSNSRLAFYSDRDNYPALYAQSLDGREPTEIVGPSVDGSWWNMGEVESLRTGDVIFVRPDGAADGGATKLMVTRPTGGERELQRSASREQQRFVHCAAGATEHCVLGVWNPQSVSLSKFDFMHESADPPFVVVDVGSGAVSFAVSPNGRTVAVFDNSPRFKLVDVASGVARTLPTTPRAGLVQDGTFSADGHTILCTAMYLDAGLNGMMAVDLEGRGELLLTNDNAWLHGPRVSPDGRAVAFTEEVSQSDVWLLERTVP